MMEAEGGPSCMNLLRGSGEKIFCRDSFLISRSVICDIWRFAARYIICDGSKFSSLSSLPVPV